MEGERRHTERGQVLSLSLNKSGPNPDRELTPLLGDFAENLRSRYTAAMPHDKEKKTNSSHTGDSVSEVAGKAFSEGLSAAEDLYGEALREVTKFVRKRPLESVAIGFGAGCLLTLLFSHRR